MKSSILLLAVIIAAFSSCTTAYKTGQTPDDVYFSPSRPQNDNEEVSSEKYDDRESKYSDQYYDDRYLRMKVHNRTRWSDLDEWYYYDRYSLGYNYYYGTYHNPYNSWNYYYNPYCCCHTNNIYSNPKTSIAYNKPRVFNLGTYNAGNNSGNTYSNPKYGGQTTTSNNTYNSPRGSSNTGRSSNSGNILRNIFNSGSSNSSSGSSSNSNHNSSSGNNNNNSSSSSSSSSGSSGSTPAPVRRF